MKILHTSDWHLGQTLRNYDREDEHRHFLRRLADITAAERPDLLAVCGDIFHSALPTIGAQALLVEALRALHKASPQTLIIIISGNHDSGARLEIYRDLWLDHNVHIIGRIRPGHSVISLPGGKGTVIAIPFQSRMQFVGSADSEGNEQDAEDEGNLMAEMLRKASAAEGPVVVMAHMALGTGKKSDTIGGLDLVPVGSMPGGYDFLALGHIHMPHTLTPRAAYCGSPFPMTFDEDYPHYVNIVEIPHAGATPEIRHVEINPLRRVVTVESDSPEGALKALAELPGGSEDYVRVIIETDTLLPADIDDRCRTALKGTAYRFCGCSRRTTEAISLSDKDAPRLEIEDFIRISPMDVARRYFEDENIPEAEALLGLLSPLIAEVNQTES